MNNTDGQKTDWKEIRAYEILGFGGSQELEDFEEIGEVLPKDFEEIIRKISAEYVKKMNEISELYRQGKRKKIVPHDQEFEDGLHVKTFLSYDQFLALHTTDIVFQDDEDNVYPEEPTIPEDYSEDYTWLEQRIEAKEYLVSMWRNNYLQATDPAESRAAKKQLSEYERQLNEVLHLKKEYERYEIDLIEYEKECRRQTAISDIFVQKYFRFNNDFPHYFKVKDGYFIDNQIDYEKFCKQYPPTITGYLCLLADSKVEKLKSFFLRKRLKFFIPSKERARHTYICGGSGSGKSELIKFMLVTDLLKKSLHRHILLIDPNGDLAEETTKTLLASGFPKEKIIYIDPLISPDKSPCINPLQINDRSENNLNLMSQELTKVFQAILKANESLSLQMKALLVPCLTTLLRHGDSSFLDLQNFVGEDEENEPYLQIGKKSPFEPHRKFFNDAFNKNNYRPTKDSIYTKVQTLLNSSVFVNLTTGKTTIDLLKILNTHDPKFIVFRLPKGSIGSDVSEAFGRFVLALVSNIGMQRASIPENERMPVYMVVDEFQNYIGGDTLKEGLAELRKYKIAYTLACQYIKQLDTDTQQAVFNNTAVKIIGQQQDPSNISIFSKVTGASTKEHADISTRNFIVKYTKKPHFTVTVPDVVYRKHEELATSEWEDFITYQVNNYYQPNTDFKAIKTIVKNQPKSTREEIPSTIKSPNLNKGF